MARSRGEGKCGVKGVVSYNKYCMTKVTKPDDVAKEVGGYRIRGGNRDDINRSKQWISMQGEEKKRIRVTNTEGLSENRMRTMS